jgi:hypothetical protein
MKSHFNTRILLEIKFIQSYTIIHHQTIYLVFTINNKRNLNERE